MTQIVKSYADINRLHPNLTKNLDKILRNQKTNVV